MSKLLSTLVSALVSALQADQIKPRLGRLRKVWSWGWAAALSLAAVSAIAGAGGYETWSAESFTLDPRESFQLRIAYADIQVRNWRLVVDGGDQNCDLLVTRTKDGALLYQLSDERHHEVDIPWGEGEEVTLVVTNRKVRGAFVVSVLGPPRDEVHASYSYHVNRALDKFAAGQRLTAAEECRTALLENPDDGVAKVLQAGFMRDRHDFAAAAAVIDEALAGELPGSMRSVAESLRDELVQLRQPLAAPIRHQFAAAERLLMAGKGAEALVVCEDLLAAEPSWTMEPSLVAAAHSRALALKGRALAQVGREYAALDAFTQALQLNMTRANEGGIYFYMGQLYLRMENLPQARGAFTMALQAGLPSSLELVAREALKSTDIRLRETR